MTPMNPNNVAKKVYGPAPAGRPPGGGKYVVRKAAPLPAGFEMINTSPDVMKRVKDTYMAGLNDKELPPALQPKRSRPQQSLTNRKISSGMSPKLGGR